VRIVVLTKRQYTNKDLIDDRYGRLWEVPMALARQGHEVTCVCLSYRPGKAVGDLGAEEGGAKIRWTSIDLGAAKLIGFLKYYFLVRKTIKEVRPDVIWSCSDTMYPVLGQHFARRFACRSVVDLYDNFEYFGSYRIPILASFYRKAVREADGVSCVSSVLSRYIASAYGRTKTTAVITNAVDVNVFRPMDKMQCRQKLGLPEDAVLIGSAGDISNYRGADMMYRAFSECAQDLGGVQLAVAGHRTIDTKIPDGENIHDLGVLAPEDVPLFLNALDLAIVYNRSSKFGDFCFPQKFYEMLACRIPVVAANVGELSSLLASMPYVLYEDGDVGNFVSAVKRQLDARELVNIPVPSWIDQAGILEQLMRSVVSGN
jgi:glycosyltransferase involved in cell wall biosynthesis